MLAKQDEPSPSKNKTVPKRKTSFLITGPNYGNPGKSYAVAIQEIWGFPFAKEPESISKKRESVPPFIGKVEDSSDLGQLPISARLEMESYPKGRTRHPWAVNVAVAEEERGSDVEHKHVHTDYYAGKFSWIPAGEISIWVPYAEEQRVVQVRHGFWLGQLLVTQEVYEKVAGTNPSFTDGSLETEEDHLPVNNISWLDAVSFCKALTIMARNHGTLLQAPRISFAQ